MVQEQRVCDGLFEAVTAWARAQGLVDLVGPRDLLRAKPAISSTKAQYLRQLYASTNPRELRDRIHQRIGLLGRLSQSYETLQAESIQ